MTTQSPASRPPAPMVSVYRTKNYVRIHLSADLCAEIGLDHRHRYVHAVINGQNVSISKPPMRNPSILDAGIRVLSKRPDSSQRFMTLSASNFDAGLEPRLPFYTSYPDYRIAVEGSTPRLIIDMLAARPLRPAA